MARYPKSLPKRFRPLWDQAQAQASLQYQGQQDLLGMLLGDAVHDRQRSVKQARHGAELLHAGLDNARTQFDQNLAASGLNTAALPGTADANRIRQTQANALNEITMRGLQADEYGASGVRQARDQFQESSQKIGQQLLGVARDRGTYTANLLDQLITGDRAARHDARQAARDQAFQAAQKELDRQTSIDKSIIGQNVNPATGEIINPRKDRGSSKSAKSRYSDPETRKASDAIEKALQYVKDGDPGKGSVEQRRAALAKTLVKGIPGTTDPLTGQRSGGVPAIPGIYVSAALDLHFGKALGRTTVKRLHERGVKIKPLGYPTVTRPRSHGRPGTSSGGGGGPHGTGRP